MDEYSKILQDLNDKHGYSVTQTPEIEALIRYTMHIAYNEGWKDGFVDGKEVDIE